ncbi:MAG TPA: glycosyltransferase family 4 protein [Candidatus Dojkabacteria bacterium]|nr:glycosyltransferase family 4 protein [Candidatus Dojkabacteria bacterium]
MKINVLELVGDHGGMNIYDKNLGNVLSALDCEVDFFTYGLDIGDSNNVKFRIIEAFNGIYSKNILKKIIHSIKGLLILLTRCASRRNSIAWANIYTFSLFEYVCMFLMYISNKKLIVTIHDISSFVDYEKKEKADYRFLNKMVALYVVHNNYSKELLSKYTNKKIAVMNDLSYEELPETISPSLSRKKIGLKEDVIIISFIGQIKNVKGVDVLIRAISEMKQEKDKIKVMIAGKFWKQDRGKYINLIEKLGVSDMILLKEGYIDQVQYPLYFWASDIVVLPYKIIYNSAVLVQALGYGSTVVCSDLAPFREFVDRNINKPMVKFFTSEDSKDLSDKLMMLVNNDKLREELKRNSRDFIVKEYSFENYKKYINNVIKLVKE